MRAAQPLMTDGYIDVQQRKPAQFLDTFAGFSQIERSADLDARLAQNRFQMRVDCLSADRI